jgi:hypothetical protein
MILQIRAFPQVRGLPVVYLRPAMTSAFGPCGSTFGSKFPTLRGLVWRLSVSLDSMMQSTGNF